METGGGHSKVDTKVRFGAKGASRSLKMDPHPLLMLSLACSAARGRTRGLYSRLLCALLLWRRLPDTIWYTFMVFELIARKLGLYVRCHRRAHLL